MDSLDSYEVLDKASFSETVIDVMDEHSQECSSSSPKTDVSYFFSQVRQFDLEWGVILVLLQSFLELSIIRVLSDSADDHQSSSLHESGS